MKPPPTNLQLERWELFLAAFQEAVAKSADVRPTVRYWRSSQLVSLIKKVTGEKKAELLTTFPSGKDVLGRLEKLGWLKPIDVDWKKARPNQVYRLEFDSQGQVTIDPLELLQGWEPEGMICYFGALQYHELTTQIPSFCHIARFRKGTPPSQPIVDLDPEPKGTSERTVDPLGTELFSLKGTTYYSTTRYPKLTPGVQTRILAGRNSLRITDYEQTLLDTLMHPLRCGGSSTIFEAWERASERIDLARLFAHLESIGQADLWRRTAAIMQLSGIGESSSLAGKISDRATKAKVPGSVFNELPILPGFDFQRCDNPWGVTVP